MREKKGDTIVFTGMNRTVIGIALVLAFAMLGINAAFAEPEGVSNISIIASERKTPQSGAAVVAQGGNVTWLNITLRSQTTAWQGFAGNITGSLVLEDVAGSQMYSWNLTNISGEIYASRNSTIDWTRVAVQNDCTVDEILTGTKSDRVSKTFSQSANTVNFSVGTIQINSSTACALRLFVNNTKQTTTNLFENIILTRDTTPNGNKSIYVGILQPTGTHGFDGQQYNFQMLVPVNRTSGFTTYYMYAELE